MVTSFKMKSQVSKLIVRRTRCRCLRSLTHLLGCETETETRSDIVGNAITTHNVSNQIRIRSSSIEERDLTSA